MKTRIALIPSYEPDEALLSITEQLLESGFIVVVVNDGSNGSYDEIFKQLDKRVHYLSYEENQGKGHALKHGFNYIKKTFGKDTIIVTMDSDGQHKVEDAIKVIEKCEEEGGLVLGSRYFDKKAPFKSRFGNFMARTTFMLSTRHRIYDTQTGLRAFNYEMLDEMIAIKGERYEYEMNVLLELIRLNVPIREVKIETIYFNNNAGTHYNPFKDTMRIFKEIIKFSASSFIGFLVDYACFALLGLLPVGWAIWLVMRNIIARIISASVNFTINYRVVFKKEENLVFAIIKYAFLAIMILACGTKLLWLFANEVGMNEYLAKILVEGTMFIISWLVQRLFVFRKKRA